MNFSRAEITHFPKKSYLKVRDKLIDLSKPQIMGIVNVTPDSFYSGSRSKDELSVLNLSEKLISEGANIIDVGACSTRPGAKKVTLKEEKSRLFPAVKSIRRHFPDMMISADTFRGTVAQECIDEGVDIINDIGGLEMDATMLDVLTKNKTAYILMHGASSFSSMHQTNDQLDIFREVSVFFSEKLNILTSAGLTEVILDPGFGFGKTIEQNYALLNQLDMLKMFGQPILTGISRKSLIHKKLNISPDESLNGTTCLNTMALLKGSSFFRVHDVQEMRQIIELINS
jgi:dihydropteroate synthase